MSVNSENRSELEDRVPAILNELKLIDEQHKERDSIYQQCLAKFKNHLNLETEQLLKSEQQIEKRNKSIRESFETVYDSIFEGSDIALRSIRRTYESKRNFWAETIKQFTNVNDLEIKKDLYSLKREAEEHYEDAIDSRKNLKKVAFRRVFSTKEPDRTLANFQQTNNVFQEKVYLGTHTSSQWRPLQNIYFNPANKENDNQNRPSFRNTQFKQGGGEGESILSLFLKK